MSRVVIAALLPIFLMAGCEVAKPGPKSAPVVQKDRARPAPAVTLPATRPAPPAPVVVVEEPGSTPQSLATDAAAYARAIERQLEERAQAKPAAVPTKPRVGGDEIQWLDAREFRLTLEPPIQPVHAVQLSAAQPGSLPAPFFNDVPAAAQVKPVPATHPVVEPQRVAGASHELEGALASQVKSNPRDVTAHLDYQLLQLLRGQAVPQLSVIGTLSAEDREVVAAVMDALTNFRTNARSNDAGAPGRKVRPLVELSERLRAANLNIPTAALCTRVDGFGIYEPAGNQFPGGRESRIILYCEIENFSSQVNAQSLWETRLTLETTLYDEKGTRVAIEERRPILDLSRNRRRDFFARGIIRIPALPAGSYSLTVTVTDARANRIAETRVPVEVMP